MSFENASVPQPWVGPDASQAPPPASSQDAPQSTSSLESAITSLWSPVNGLFEWFGELGIFAWQVMRSAFRRPFEGRELLRQLDEIGSKSLPLVALAGAAIGAVLTLESRYSLIRFRREIHASGRHRVLDRSRNRSRNNRAGGLRKSRRGHRRGVGVNEGDGAD